MKQERKIHFSAAMTEELLESQLKEKLSLSFEERIAAHENARKLLSDLHKAGKELRAKPQQAS